MKQQAQPIVLEVAHAVGDPAELLGDQVLGFALGVGVPGDEEREDPGLPSTDGARKPRDLGDTTPPGEPIEGIEVASGTGDRAGRIHLAQLFFGHQGRPHLVEGITVSESSEESSFLTFALALPAPGEESADPIERIVSFFPDARWSLAGPADGRRRCSRWPT